jgi:signal transduction histidine kinase
LLSALRWYATGFAERSGIKVELDLPEAFDRLGQDVETTLFRVVQEALINIHRHAGSQIAYVRLKKDVRRLSLEVEDRGCGLAEGLAARMMTTGQGVGVGVGVAGMRERLKQLGGSLEIESNRRGTTVQAVVPLESDTS